MDVGGRQGQFGLHTISTLFPLFSIALQGQRVVNKTLDFPKKSMRGKISSVSQAIWQTHLVCQDTPTYSSYSSRMASLALSGGCSPVPDIAA